MKKLKVGAVDIDVFANVIRKEEQLDELEHLLIKLRKSRRTKDTLESTHHAVCRSYMAFNALERLLKVAQNRVEYGIFPDYHCSNMMLDRLIESKDFRNAAKAGVLVALQEEFENPITNRLALYAIYKYVSDPERQPWDDSEAGAQDTEPTAEAANEDEEEEEILYVRIPRIRNPYHDDHFDIAEPMRVLGKALFGFGKQFDDIAGRSCQLLGLTLHEKWPRVNETLLNLKKRNASEKLFTKDCIDRITEAANALAAEHESKQAANSVLQELQPLSGRCSEEPLEALLSAKLPEIGAFEQQDKLTLVRKFEQWEIAREQALKRQLDELLRDERIKEIEAKRRELEEREKLLFFFENQDKHEMDLAHAEQLTEKLRSHIQVEEEYIPPTLR